MNLREQNILKAIIESFLKKGTPVGSLCLFENYHFDVSPATIRNDMATLEEQGYLMQPHTSSGRIPTSRGYRFFVDQMKMDDADLLGARRQIQDLKRQYRLQKAKEQLYTMVSILADVTQSVSFATLPESPKVFYVGISHMLRQPEFILDSVGATRVVETVEYELYDLLNELSVPEEGVFYIGEENILPQFQTCSLFALPYVYHDFHGVMGVLGPIRMDYKHVMASLRSAIQLLDS